MSVGPQDLVDAAKLKKALELERRQTHGQDRKAPEQPAKEQAAPTQESTQEQKKDLKHGRGFGRGM